MKSYDHTKIEKKWQKEWEKSRIYEADDRSLQKKFYPLVEFPFPSGAGLHVGHIRSYTGMDIIARKHRMEGENVLYPMGWDAFGLPTENYAIKTGVQPKIVTKKNTDTFRKQLKSLGLSFDWSREINTTDPSYYKWTQWIFLKLYEKGLAYKAGMNINWCPKDKIGLANEEVIDGHCERCGTLVEKKFKEQWMLKITEYADRLYRDLDEVDYLPQIKTQQQNWIGKSEGAEITFKIEFENGSKPGFIPAFTTRPDTIFGVTYVVLSPEHPLVEKLLHNTQNKSEVIKYVADARIKTEIERTDAKKEKTGVELKGIKVINPANNEEVPVWVADYVLSDYGTGAVMAVPAHDERDFEFAKKYKLPIKTVVIRRFIDEKNPHVPGKEISFRRGILGIVRNPKTGKYLCLKWKKQPWTTFVTGGINGDENPADAARREIAEETGYKNLKLIKVSPLVQTEFFAAHKNVNRIAHSNCVFFDLEDETKESVSKEEVDMHEVVWLDLPNRELRHAEIDFILEQMKSSEKSYDGSGVLIDSGKFSGKLSDEVKKDITKFVGGKWVIKYKLRDWIFSRQRYWGEPIPMIHCEKCGWVPVPKKDLPIKLPEVKKYEPTDTGESPLSTITKWVNIKCPTCKGKAKRETDTMPNWAGSSWYYLRYLDAKNKKEFASQEKIRHWMPVDWYNGGMEHTTLHLLYSRFWHKVLYDLGLVNTNEPYQKRTSQGIILAEDGDKMSKSKGNVVNPNEIVETYGADTLRLYEMFMGPFTENVKWSTDSIIGLRRFIERVWKTAEKLTINNSQLTSNQKVKSLLHKTIKKVTEDIGEMRFNTAISALMILQNEIDKEGIGREDFEAYIKLIAPFGPHFTEEIWSQLGHPVASKARGASNSIHTSEWPKHDESLIKDSSAKIAVQINGKVRSVVEMPVDATEEEVKKQALSDPAIQKWLAGKTQKKIIYVKGRVINIIVNS